MIFHSFLVWPAAAAKKKEKVLFSSREMEKRDLEKRREKKRKPRIVQ